jgi:ActR/RegA family two-component response regulator
MAAVAVSPRTLEHPDLTRWVLAVTDDARVQRRTCRALVRAGFAVEVALDAVEALRCLDGDQARAAGRRRRPTRCG